MLQMQKTTTAAIVQAQALGIVGLFVTFVTGVLTARALGVEGRGEYNLLIMVGGLMGAALSLGIPSSITYFVGAKRIPPGTMTKSCAVAALVLGMVGVLATEIASRIGILQPLLNVPVLDDKLRLVIYSLPITLYGSFVMHLMLAEGRAAAFNILPVASQIATFGMLLMLHFQWGLSVSRAIVIGIVVQIAMVLWVTWYRGNVWQIVYSKMLSAKQIRSFISYAFTAYVANLIQFINYRISAFIVNYHLGHKGLGIFTLATALSELLWLISRPAATIIFPRVSGDAPNPGHGPYVGRIAGLVFYASIAGAVALAALMPSVIPLVYGLQFADSSVPFLLLLPGVVAFSITNILAALLAGAGRPDLNLVVSLVSTVVCATMSSWLVPGMGLNGAALSMSAGYVTATILIVAMARRSMGVQLEHILSPPRVDEVRTAIRKFRS